MMINILWPLDQIQNHIRMQLGGLIDEGSVLLTMSQNNIQSLRYFSQYFVTEKAKTTSVSRVLL